MRSLREWMERSVRPVTRPTGKHGCRHVAQRIDGHAPWGPVDRVDGAGAGVDVHGRVRSGGELPVLAGRLLAAMGVMAAGLVLGDAHAAQAFLRATRT